MSLPYLLSFSFYCSDLSGSAVALLSAAFALILLVFCGVIAELLLAADILREPGVFGLWGKS